MSENINNYTKQGMYSRPSDLPTKQRKTPVNNETGDRGKRSKER